MKFADRFKECRTDIGLTQTELAELVGTSQNSINKIEQGITKKPRFMYELVSVFKVNAEWLVEGKGEKKAKSRKLSINEPNQDYQARTKRHPDIERLITILAAGDMTDKGFRTLVKSFTDIIELLSDVEQYTNEHREDSNNIEKRENPSRPWWRDANTG